MQRASQRARRAPLRVSGAFLWALSALVSVLFSAPAGASTVRAASTADCAFKAAWSSSSEELYRLAYDWSKTHDISDWQFSVQANNCSKVTYTTRIHVPSVFSALWKRHSIEMKVDKRVCVRGQSLRETLVISQLPFIDDVLIHVDATASAATASTALTADYAVVVPWYLAMIDAPVQEHVRKSVGEYLDILKLDICR